MRGVSAEQLRAFLTSVLIKPGKPHHILRFFRPRPAAEPPKPVESPKEGSPALVPQERKT